jgi:aprataxin
MKRIFTPYRPPATWPAEQGFWREALVRIVKTRNADSIWYQEEDWVVCYDKFPKARCHLLAVPAQDIPSITSLCSDHIPLLEQLGVLAEEIRA